MTDKKAPKVLKELLYVNIRNKEGKRLVIPVEGTSYADLVEQVAEYNKDEDDSEVEIFLTVGAIFEK